MLVAALTTGGPSLATAAFDAVNADKVDGTPSAPRNSDGRAGKLVATDPNGRLPSNIIAQAPNAALLGGLGPDGGPTTAGNAQALAKNAHVLRDHPDVHVTPTHYQHRPPDNTGPPDDNGPPGGPPGTGPTGRPPPDETPGTTLEQLQDNAPNIEWTLPTGHRYTTEPPPALSHGSTAPTTRSVMELELTLMAQRATAKG